MRHATKESQEMIDNIFNEIEIQLSKKLLTDGFQAHSQITTPKALGSKFTEWRHSIDKYALRLVWDEKEGCFSIEESPFTSMTTPNSWADIVLVTVDRAKLTETDYRTFLIDDIVKEIR